MKIFKFCPISRLLLLFVSCALLLAAGSASAATYYADSSCQYSGNGTAGTCASSAGGSGAFKTIADVNNKAFAAGDDVYFKCGGIWNAASEGQRVQIDWSGLSGNYATVGAYYLNGSSPVIGVSGAKPVIRGNLVFNAAKDTAIGLCGQGGGDTGTGCFPQVNSYDALIEANSREYVRVENIRTENSPCYGIYIHESDDVAVVNCESSFSGAEGIAVSGGSPWNGSGTQNVFISENFVEKAVYGGWYNETKYGGPVSLYVGNGAVNATVSRNKVQYPFFGESIGSYYNSTNITIEDNEIYGITKIGVYLSGNIRNSVVRRNKIIGVTESIPGTSEKSMFWLTDNGTNWYRWPYVGIAIEDEWAYASDYKCGVAPWNSGWSDVRCHTQDIDIYDNLIGNVAYGMYFFIPDPWSQSWTGSQWVTTGDSILERIDVYNNTIVAPRRGAFLTSEGANDCLNCNFKNNLTTCADAAVCVMTQISANQGWSVSNNLWSVNPGSPMAGSGDVVNSASGLSKMSGWISATASGISASDFRIISSSPAIDRGAALGSPFNTDYFGAARPQGAGWDMGAHEYGSATAPDQTAPSTPSGLSVR